MNEHETLAAFDVASATGVAFGGQGSSCPSFITWKLPPLSDLDRAMVSLFDSVSQLLGLIKAKHVYIEAPLYITGRSQQTALDLISLAAVARCAAHRHGARVRLVHVQTVRKHFVGAGRPENPKQAVMQRCRLLGWTPADDNQGDAGALWAYGMAQVYPKWSPRSTPLFGRKVASSGLSLFAASRGAG